jgi:hypothetical protein
MKNVVFWDVMPCGSCKNRRVRGTYHLHHQAEKNQGTKNNVSSNLQLKVAAKNPILLILSTLMMKAIPSSEMSILT